MTIIFIEGPGKLSDFSTSNIQSGRYPKLVWVTPWCQWGIVTSDKTKKTQILFHTNIPVRTSHQSPRIFSWIPTWISQCRLPPKRVWLSARVQFTSR